MNFEHTVWLYITAAIVFIAASMITLALRRRESLLGKFAASRLLEQLTEKASNTRTLIKAVCILIGLTAVGIALARPQYGVEWSERKARGLDIVFVLDSSKSMLATDMRPTRLDRAKLAVIDLIERLESDRIGLVAFAGRAFLQTPPTLDYSAFRESLEAVGPQSMTSGGSDLGNAIKEAEKAFPQDNNFKVIILLTDGEDLGGSAIETAKAAAKNGIKVYAIGIGTPEGDYLRIRNEQGEETFIRDDAGQPVRSQLDESTLQEIAQLTGGTYSRLSSQSLTSLYNSVIATLPREEREAEMQERPIERYQWAIGIALIFLVLEILIRRRGNPRIYAAIFAIALIPALPQTSEAQESIPLDIEAENEAVEAEPVAISEDARSSYNQAYVALTAGDMDTAKTLYQSSIAQTNDVTLQRDALYNLAHSTYQTGRQTYSTGDLEKSLEEMQAAEALFNSALEIDPNDSAAAEDLKKVTTVREAIEKLKEEQQPQEPEDSKENQDDSEENQDESEENQDSEEQDDSEQDEDSEEQSQEDQASQEQDSEEQDGEQSDNQEESDDQSQDSESQGEDGEPSEDESEQSSPGDESPEEQESTGNPADDMADDEQSPQDEEAGGQGSEPQPSEDEQTEEDAEAAQSGGSAMQVEGMTQEDAAALLESLRGGEKLLPFVDQGTPRNPEKIRDW
ncbi:MAG: VWA domain-containing protein [Lentimonas sp.]